MSVFVVVLLLSLAWADGYCGSTGYDYCGCTELAPLPNASFLSQFSLSQLQVVFRHGDRTPVNILPAAYLDEELEWDCELDSYVLVTDLNAANGTLPSPPSSTLFLKQYDYGVEVLPGNCYYGQLTLFGLQQHEAIGAAAVAMYAPLGVPVAYSASTVHVRSTDVPRTLDSVQGEMSALFGFNLTSSGPQTIALHTRDLAIDTMAGPNPSICPRLQRAQDRIAGSKAWADLLKKYDWVYKQFQKAFPKAPAPSTSDLEAIADILHARTCHGKPFPPGLDANFAQGVFDFAMEAFALQYNDTETLSLGIGNFLADMVSELTSRQYRLLLWSGHDSTILPLQRVFGYWDLNWPPYASHLFLEVWTKNDNSGTQYVRLHLNGFELTPPGCANDGPICPIGKFLAGIAPYVVKDFFAACQ